MTAKNRKAKNKRKINLMEMSEAEKANLIQTLRQNLRHSISEAKLWKTLLRYEKIMVNGQVVFSENIQ